MTKRELIGNMLLMVSGGRPTSDMSVRESDIRTYLAPAINMGIDMGDNMNRNEGIERDYNSEFYGTYTDVVIDRTSNIPYVELVEGTVPLKGNAGIRAVYDDCGDFYGKITDGDRPNIKYYTNIAECMKWYYRLGNKLQLYGLSDMVEKINYDALTNIDDLGDDDQLPLLAGTEEKVLDFLRRLVLGEIENPYDKRIDHDDVNKER